MGSTQMPEVLRTLLRVACFLDATRCAFLLRILGHDRELITNSSCDTSETA
jgi:hypothetical protein